MKNLISIVVFCLCMLSVSVNASSFSIDENIIDNETLEFIVHNDGYSDITWFVIGNPNPTDAFVTSNVNLNNGYVASRNWNDNEWYILINGYNEKIDWMSNLNNEFDNEYSLFLFTSWDGENYNGYLEEGITNGYIGKTEICASPVAAYSESLGIIYGGEANVVPIPTSILLLISGLSGLSLLKRKNS